MGSFQKEWLIYFYQAENYEYSDWLYFLRTGFKHCGGLTYSAEADQWVHLCLLYTSPSPRDRTRSRMPSSA